ncbi:MAG: hypothetical protein J3K34DRAFT_398779 [Monoraphidium minutum]|nr:MAG: hypothetical protein J3K34DRAFT_398779 [Monoraphidium minutum]
MWSCGARRCGGTSCASRTSDMRRRPPRASDMRCRPLWTSDVQYMPPLRSRHAAQAVAEARRATQAATNTAQAARRPINGWRRPLPIPRAAGARRRPPGPPLADAPWSRPLDAPSLGGAASFQSRGRPARGTGRPARHWMMHRSPGRPPPCQWAAPPTASSQDGRRRAQAASAAPWARRGLGTTRDRPPTYTRGAPRRHLSAPNAAAAVCALGGRARARRSFFTVIPPKLTLARTNNPNTHQHARP